MTRTDTLGQLVDRAIVCALKERSHLSMAGNHEEASACRDQADRLWRAARELLTDMVAGKGDVPPPWRHARFHDHSKVEGDDWRPPDDLGRCVDGLVQCHSLYWDHQTQIHAVRRAKNAKSPAEPGHDELNAEIVLHQRWCDLMNQRRNALIQRIDELLAEALRRGPAPVF